MQSAHVIGQRLERHLRLKAKDMYIWVVAKVVDVVNPVVCRNKGNVLTERVSVGNLNFLLHRAIAAARYQKIATIQNIEGLNVGDDSLSALLEQIGKGQAYLNRLCVDLAVWERVANRIEVRTAVAVAAK